MNGISNFGSSHQFAGVNFTANANGVRGTMTPRDSGSGSSQQINLIRQSAGFSGQGLDSRGSHGFGGFDSRGHTPMNNGGGGLFSPRVGGQAPGSAQLGIVRGIASLPISPRGEMANVTSAPDLLPV